jgi:soluble lytic murein transglycosylase-like protein
LIDPILFCLVFQNLISFNKIDATPESAKVFCEHAESLVSAAQANGISPFILASIIYTESRWSPDRKSPRGACGLAQVIPKYYGVTCQEMIDHPELAIETGAFAFSAWKKQTKGDRHKALQCYSTGNKCSYPGYADRVIYTANLFRKTYERLDK